jgi:lycopene cyclase domain-containing protein
MLRFLYLSIDMLAVIFPLLWSFEKKMYFFSKWKFAFKSIAITAAIFIVWDLIFTYFGIWGFNFEYTIGLKIINLPIEEILFFFTMPFACLFIYETVYFLWRDTFKSGFFYQISLVAGLFLFLFGFYHYDKLYTCFACVGTSFLLGYHCSRKKQMNHEVFWVAYLIVLIPFGIINGILTGGFTKEPIVWYNDAENLGIRIFTIPVEDFAYTLMLMLLNVTLYKRFIRLGK